MTFGEVTTRHEELVFIPSGGESLCTVITRPVETSNNDTAIVLVHPTGSTNSSFHKDRLWVHTARRLAARGFTVARFDARGVGDSSGTLNQFRLEQPFVDDLDHVCGHLENCGMRGFALVGHCGGARTALAHAARSANIRALVLAQMPLRDYGWGERGRSFAESFAERADLGTFLRRGFRWTAIKGLRDAGQRQRYRQAIAARMRRRVPSVNRRGARDRPVGDGTTISAEVQAGLTTSVARRVPVLLIYGERDLEYRDVSEIDADGVDPDLAAIGSWVDIRTLAAEEDLFGLPNLASRASFVDCLTEWLVETLSTGQRS